MDTCLQKQTIIELNLDLQSKLGGTFNWIASRVTSKTKPTLMHPAHLRSH